MSEEMLRRVFQINLVNVSSLYSKMSSNLKAWLEMDNCEAFVMHGEKCLIGV